jgi:DNA-binding transcriptional ArsR family regulator
MSRASRTRARILRELGHGELPCRDLRAALSDVDRPTWDRAVRELVAAGVVARDGRTNRAVYRLAATRREEGWS